MQNKFLLILFCTKILFGQTVEQVKKAKELIQRSGMSEEQVREAAKYQGYTDQQIDAAIKKGKAGQGNDNQSANENKEELVQLDFGKSNEVINEKTELQPFDDGEMEIVDEAELDINSQSQPDKSKSLSYFGYDIFSRDPALFQATSVGAVDPDYTIGPGDEIIVMLWGETQFRQVLTVDREGFVFIPEIGQVFVNGLNLNLLESKLFRVFSQSYASLNPQNRTPTTFLDVSLGNLRPLRIQVLGEVNQPGAYTVSPSATLFSALYFFNGPTTLGSLRDIHLIRGGQKIASIDFYDYLLTGRKPMDMKLQLDDVIFVPRRLKTVSIEGEINRSGIYELKPSETLSDLITIAGDLKISAYLDRAQIDRIVSFEEREELGMDRIYTDVNMEQILKSELVFPLQDGDRIQVFSVLDLRQNVVDIRGSVTRPGSYDLGKSLKLTELINNADGLLGDAYLERVDIVRINSDFTEELIKLNLGEALEDNVEHNIKLKGMDRVRIYGMTEMVPKTYVSIVGHVKRPGRFLLRENMRLYDLIFKSGGFIDDEFKKQTYLGRADLLRKNNDGITTEIKSFNLGDLLSSSQSIYNLPLEPNDVVRIYHKDIFINNTTTTINGIVKNPGSYKLKSNMTLKDLILEAGGLDHDTYRYRAEIARIDPLNDDLDKYAEVITFNMDEKFSLSPVKLSDGSKTGLIPNIEPFYLNPYDLVSIRPDPFFKEHKKVTISGEILYPGVYSILTSDEKITDIIDRAGGLLTNAYPSGSQYSRNGVKLNVAFDKIIKKPSSKLNFIVQDGDKINLLSYPNVINIMGEVNTPGIHKYVPGKRLRYYLSQAGGLKPNADKTNIWIEYPNGNSKKYKPNLILSPIIIDGSKIFVGVEPPSEPFDKTEFAKDLTAIIANLSQALAVIFLAAK